MRRRSFTHVYRLPESQAAPLYATLPDRAESGCSCGGRCTEQGCNGSGMLLDAANAVRSNPIAFLLGAFALGYVLKGKK